MTAFAGFDHLLCQGWQTGSKIDDQVWSQIGDPVQKRLDMCSGVQQGCIARLGGSEQELRAGDKAEELALLGSQALSPH
jgi:hypothetical protein